MKYGFTNRIPCSVYTKTKQLGNLVNSVFLKKKSQLSCLVLGKANINLPVIFVTCIGHRTGRDYHDVASPFL